MSVELPDKALQQAYQWAQVSVLQGVVQNQFLGTSLIAGYKTSSDDARPGFAWFFGRDALWTALALDAEGDFSTTKSALEFLSTYQKSDGKVPHEISQSASFVPWFQGMPYAYASADATPLFIVATQNYVQRSGDTAFAKDKWDNLWRAYQFMTATYDANGIRATRVWAMAGWKVARSTEPKASSTRQALYCRQCMISVCWRRKPERRM